MVHPVPIGQREGAHLEFQSAAALKHPMSIARVVVAMLNASGGAVWIGLVEHDGIATREENVPDADSARATLRDVLLHRIDPEPIDDEVHVEVVRGNSGARVLRIAAAPIDTKRPYALKDEGLQFLTRVNHRVRAMTREEIASAMGGQQKRVDERAAQLARLRGEVLARPESRFWLAVQPSSSLDLDTSDPGLEELLTDPTLAGNRRSGWSYGGSGLRSIRRADGSLQVGEDEHRRLTLAPDGLLQLTMPLHWLGVELMAERGELHPLALLEYPISVMRLTRQVHRFAPKMADRFLLDLILTGTERWVVPPYAPGTYGHMFVHDRPRALEDYVPHAPWSVEARDLEANPDKVGFRIARDVFSAFGLRDENVPAQYDRRIERLTLTD